MPPVVAEVVLVDDRAGGQDIAERDIALIVRAPADGDRVDRTKSIT
jgi:hypothetical protein